MSSQENRCATNGDENSYHGDAAVAYYGPGTVPESYSRFSDLIKGSWQIGRAIMAIQTVYGPVEAAASEIVRKHRPDTLPKIVGRVDRDVPLSVVCGVDVSLEDLGNGHGVTLYVQKPARDQSLDFIKQHWPQIRTVPNLESSEAMRQVIADKDPKKIAIGPSFAIDALGGHRVGPTQVNPAGSRTSFYAMQLDPTTGVPEPGDDQVEKRAVLTLARPDGQGEMEKVVNIIEEMGLRICRYIRFDIGDFTKHGPDLRRGGGILEIQASQYDGFLHEFCHAVNILKSNDNADGPFSAKILGDYSWVTEGFEKPEILLR